MPKKQKPRFEKDKKGQTIFIDSKGRIWTDETLDDLIKAVFKYAEFKDTVDYYFDVIEESEEEGEEEVEG